MCIYIIIFCQIICVINRLFIIIDYILYDVFVQIYINILFKINIWMYKSRIENILYVYRIYILIYISLKTNQSFNMGTLHSLRAKIFHIAKII